MRQCNIYLKKTFEIVNQMLYLADDGDAAREDAGCGVICGILRDSAYRIKKKRALKKKPI